MSVTVVRTIDAHAAGEPLRVVTEGLPEIPGDTMLERRRWARAHLDGLRRALMLEPRGHADMYGCLLTPPATADGDAGVLFMHNEGFSTMCGHGVIALVTIALEHGLIAPAEPPLVRLDTPAGRVTATAHVEGEAVERVTFENVPSFVERAELEVQVEGIGRLRCDVAFGGAFYAYADAAAAGVELSPENHAELVVAGTAISRAVTAVHRPAHPASGGGDPDGDLDLDLDFLYGTILVGPAAPGSDAHSRNACVFAAGQVDRSPTGTGVSGRAALHFARGELRLGQTIAIESLIGTRFDVRALRETTVGGRPAIVPEVGGRAWVTGRHEFRIDTDDPLCEGILLR